MLSEQCKISRITRIVTVYIAHTLTYRLKPRIITVGRCKSAARPVKFGHFLKRLIPDQIKELFLSPYGVRPCSGYAYGIIGYSEYRESKAAVYIYIRRIRTDYSGITLPSFLETKR